jgi:hypothetical protein
MLALTMTLALGAAPDARTLPPVARVYDPRCPIALGMTEEQVNGALIRFSAAGFSHPGKNWQCMRYYPQANGPKFDTLRVLYVDGIVEKFWKCKPMPQPRFFPPLPPQ